MFIPAVAVVFIAVTLFLCGPGKKETQSTAETHTISGELIFISLTHLYTSVAIEFVLETTANNAIFAYIFESCLITSTN